MIFNNIRIWIVTAILTLAYTWSYIDRYIYSILIDAMKQDLQVSDSLIGLIHSVSFSLFMLLAMLPLAKIADTSSRPRLIVWCISIWSVMAMACGLAGHWLVLFFTRAGVAIGETGMPPAVLSYLSDIVERKNLPRVSSVFLLGPFLGGGIAMLGGGYLYDAISAWDYSDILVVRNFSHWQLTFILVGAPGLLIALLAALTLREVDRTTVVKSEQRPIKDVFIFLTSIRRFYLPYVLAISLIGLVFNSYIIWMPAMLMRSYAITASFAGAIIGLVYLCCGVLGSLFAGWLISLKSGSQVLRRALAIITWSGVALLPLSIAAPLIGNLLATGALFAFMTICTSSVIASSNIPMQILSPQAIRTRSISILSMVMILIGIGFGPVSVGILSDLLGDLQRSLSMVAALSLIPAMGLLYLANRALADDGWTAQYLQAAR